MTDKYVKMHPIIIRLFKYGELILMYLYTDNIKSGHHKRLMKSNVTQVPLIPELDVDNEEEAGEEDSQH